MNCENCLTNETVISYNADLGKYLLKSSSGNTHYAQLMSNSMVHGFSNILASNNAFIADEGIEISPLPKQKLLQEAELEFMPCFIIELQYDISSIDTDTLDVIVPCQSLYYSAGQILKKGVTTPNAHFCGKVCARELYRDTPGFAKITHVASPLYADCANIAKPGHIVYTDLNFTGVDQYGRAVISAPILEDFPGIEPAVHKSLVISSASIEFNYFGICPQGTSSYSNITAFAGSRGEIFSGLPNLICVPLCGSASGIYTSSHNLNSINKGYDAYPDSLLIDSISYAEWMIGDALPALPNGNLPDPPFSYMLPAGQSNSCGFSDNPSGREYYINDYQDSNRPIVFAQSQIGTNSVTTDSAGNIVGNFSGPETYRTQAGQLHILQGQPTQNSFGRIGVYTHIIKTAVPKLVNGLFSLERLPYRESVTLYDRDFKPQRTIRDFVVLVPKAKQPNEWVAYSLIRMKKAETDFSPTFDEASLSLVTSELGDRVFASCKYGFYEPSAITTNDQLKTAYADYHYSLVNEGIDNFSQGLDRTNAAFSPNRRIGNYGYEPYILPGQPRPPDVTDCQDSLKHTHTVLLDGTAYLMKHDFIADSELLADALLSNSPQDFTLQTFNCTNTSAPVSSSPTHATVQGIADAINSYFATAAPGNTVADITYSEIKRIKPLAI